MKRKMFCGVFSLLAMYGVLATESDLGGSETMTGTPPGLGEISTSFAERSTSYLTGTLSIPVTSLGGGEGETTLQVELSRDAEFSDVFATFSRSVKTLGTEVFDLAGITPSSTTYVRMTATAADGASVTDATYSFTASAGWVEMCYKPPEKKQDYPWTWDDYWYSEPSSTGTGLKYCPSLGDDVVLYSSKTSTKTSVPFRIGADVHAETRGLLVGSGNDSDHHQLLLIESNGTLTNAGDVIVGAGGVSRDMAGHVRLFGEWNAWKSFSLGQSKHGSTLTIEAGGRFVNTNTPPPSGTAEGSVMLLGNAAVAADNVVTNKGDMYVTDLHFGSSPSSRGILENYGTLNVGRKLTIGRNGYGRLHLHPGSTLRKRFFHDKPVIIGSSSNTEGILESEADMELAAGDRIEIANSPSSKGTLILSNATLRLSGLIRLGRDANTQAQVELRDNAAIQFTKTSELILGGTRATGTVSRVTLRGVSKLDGAKNLTIPSGDAVTGIVEVLDRSIVTNLAEQSIILGMPAFSYGRLVVGENSFIGPITTLRLSTERQTPFADVEMRGGTIGLVGGGSGAYQLFLGNAGQDGVHARIIGWGRFLRLGESLGSDNMLRMVPHGQLIADGQDELHDLDFSNFRTVDSQGQNSTGSNGWYAVSKGRLIYPRIQNISGSSHCVVGDYPNRKTPLLVNSLRFTMSSYPSKAGGDYHAYAELYAPDRTDIPQGLPTGKGGLVKGVWRLAFSSGSGLPIVPTPVDFAGLTLQIRHDTEGIGEDYRLTVYHHDGSASGGWQTVMKTKVFNPEDPYVVTETPVNPSSETWNAGWFALVARPREKGVTIILR